MSQEKNKDSQQVKIYDDIKARGQNKTAYTVMNQIKRKLGDNIFFDDETSTVRKRKSITSIEHLSNDLFYEIFEYLEGFDINKAFSNLNTRFQELLKHIFLQLKFYFPLESKLQFHNRLKNVIFPNKNRIISIRTIGTQNNDTIFSSITIDSSFNRLESLTLWKIKVDTLLSVLRSLPNLPCLFSLTIIVSDHFQTVSSVDPYLLIFNLPTLKYLKLSYESINELSIQSWTNNNYSLSSLQYLIIDHACNLSKLIAMLSYTPQLRHLCCQHLYGSDQPIESNMNITLTNLTHLSLYESRVPFHEFSLPGTRLHFHRLSSRRTRLQFNQLEALIKKTGFQLQVLRLKTAYDRTYFNGDRWKQLFVGYAPHLRLFEFEHQDKINDDVEFTTDHALIHHFTSKFWIKPRWVIKFKFSSHTMGDLCIIISTDDQYKEQWCQLNKFSKNYSTSDQQSQFVVLTISNRSAFVLNNVYLAKLKPVFDNLKITHLIIECLDIFVGGLIKVLNLLPCLDSLKMRSISLLKPRCLSKEEMKFLDLISKKNNITKVNLKQINELDEVQFLIDLCPHLQDLKIDCFSKIDLKILVKSILIKTTQNITQLHTLCLNGKQSNDEIIKELQEMIKFEQSFPNYIITCLDEKIYVQLE